MKKLKILTGISGAGKSFYAHNEWLKDPMNVIIINRDKIRELLYSYTEETVNEYYHRSDFQYLESQVTAIQDNIINFWLKRDKDVIIDATNLKKSYIKDFDKFGVPTEVVYFDVTLKEALTRNMGRKRQVDETVIKKQYNLYINLRKNLHN